jgi:hypothetical protein
MDQVVYRKNVNQHGFRFEDSKIHSSSTSVNIGKIEEIFETNANPTERSMYRVHVLVQYVFEI